MISKSVKWILLPKSLFAVISLVACPVIVHAQQLSYKDCIITLQNDTLTVENSRISQQFQWNNGQLIPLEISRKDIPVQHKFSSKQVSDFVPFSKNLVAKNAKIKLRISSLSAIDPSYLQAEITYNLNKLQVKRTVEIHPETAAITHYFALKGITENVNLSKEEKADLAMIESDEETEITQPTLAKFSLNKPHWQIEAISFKEATDHHNTLTSIYKLLAYNKPEKVMGNILLATNPLNKSGIFILKESPLRESQASYTGADFEISNSEINVLGTGIPWQSINTSEWTRGYGYTVGLNRANKNSLLLDLKECQKQRRGLLPGRDEMILANTWGDRSKDSRMNEAFILEEIEVCSKMGITHLQLDDGWQQGLSRNSASKAGMQWDDWSTTDWQPHKERFPNGFKKILQKAKKDNIEICLWFNPSKKNEYSNWERDANILIDLYRKYDIKVFKIDGIELSSKTAEINLRSFFEKVNNATEGEIVFNMDVTAGHRMGYFYFLEYGNLFLENRYTDWANYYPHSTLRNLWMLSKYIPAEKIQVEFLNKWRNASKYPLNDPLAPANIPFAYQIASTFAGQPLAWMEVSQLPDEAMEAVSLLEAYRTIQHDFHNGIIMPIGEEPNGLNWSGFQSVKENEGYILLFRAYSEENEKSLQLILPPNKKVDLKHVLGDGSSFEGETNEQGELKFSLPKKHSFVLYKYSY